MILREVQIENFRQITGSHRIKFAQPGQRPLTVLLGENGSGKTTFLNACLWCLYGRRSFENPEELASYQALANETSGPVPVRVRLVFDAAGKRYTGERKLTVNRDSDGSLDPSESEFYLSYTDQDGESITCEVPSREIERLLPRNLAGFFFFQGEDLEHLVAQSGADALQTAVEQFVDLKLLNRSIKHLQKAEKELERHLRGQVSGEAKELSERIEEKDAELEDIVLKSERANDERQKLLEQKEGIEEELREFQEIQPKIDRKRELEKLIEEKDDSLTHRSKEFAKLISRDGFLYLNPDILATGSRLAETAVESGELPANIKPQFVDDLLEDGECICGRELGEYEKSFLREWKGDTEIARLESAIIEFRSGLGNLGTRTSEFEQDFEEKRATLDRLRDERRELVAEKTRLNDELEEGELGVDVGKLQTLLAEINDKLQDLSFREGKRSSRKEDLEREREELSEQREKLLEKKQKAKKTSRRVGSARHVGNALKEFREGWIGLVQKYLDKELKRNWKEMAQLDRLVDFDEQLSLSIKERGGDGEWVRSAPSSANQRALALAFVTSLIRLAKEAGEADDSAMLFSGGSYPLVMDAPFATMDRYFKKTIPEGLVGIVPQLVLASSFDQWDGTVSNVLDSKVGRAYVFELHGPEVDTKKLSFQGTDITYKTHEPGATYDWTVIREVKK